MRMGAPWLETHRLWLRPPTAGDVQAVLALRGDARVARYQYWQPYTRADAERFVTENAGSVLRPGDWWQLVMEDKMTGMVIGDIAACLDGENLDAEIGFNLLPSRWGRGYGAEAAARLLDELFGPFGLHRAHAVTGCENLGSVRLLEKLGMRREAHLVENVWFKGAWGSEYLYALLAREWR